MHAGSDAAAFLDNGVFTVDFKGVKHALCAASELQIKGEHNASNALAAASCAIALDCDDAKIKEGLKSFAPLEHRIEPCGTIAGVHCYNDSKATNVDATLKALAAFGEERPSFCWADAIRAPTLPIWWLVLRLIARQWCALVRQELVSLRHLKTLNCRYTLRATLKGRSMKRSNMPNRAIS